jgi:hypothetical protein
MYVCTYCTVFLYGREARVGGGMYMEGPPTGLNIEVMPPTRGPCLAHTLFTPCSGL